jgi:hypothetical protein
MFDRSDRDRTIGAPCSKKISLGSRRMQDFRVGNVTMMLRYCHTCVFLARFLYVAFHLPAWLKGFCAVAGSSQAMAIPITVAPHALMRLTEERVSCIQIEFPTGCK